MDDLTAIARAAGAARPLARVPHYNSITAGAMLLRAVALVLAAVGVLLIWLSPPTQDQPPATRIIIVLPSAGLFVAALLLNLIGSLAIAVRDVARNSFRR